MNLAHHPPAVASAGGVGGFVLSHLVRWVFSPNSAIEVPLHVEPIVAGLCDCPTIGTWRSCFAFLLRELCANWQLAIGFSVSLGLLSGVGRYGLSFTVCLGTQRRAPVGRTRAPSGLDRITAYKG